METAAAVESTTTAMEPATATMSTAAALSQGRRRRQKKGRCYCNTKTLHFILHTGHTQNEPGYMNLN